MFCFTQEYRGVPKKEHVHIRVVSLEPRGRWVDGPYCYPGGSKNIALCGRGAVLADMPIPLVEESNLEAMGICPTCRSEYERIAGRLKKLEKAG